MTDRESALEKVMGYVRRDGSCRPVALIRLVFKALDALVVFLSVKLLGSLAYDARFLSGRYYERLWSPGWRWAFNGMVRKLFTGHGRGVPWPVGAECNCSPDVSFHVDDLNNFQGNVYFQAFEGAHITLGQDVWIARGCALITSNHDPVNPADHLPAKDIEIGDHSWLGTNVVVMPGVKLGPHTVVGANAVVTKSCVEGHCVLAGVPARKIRELDRGDEFDGRAR